MSLADLGDVFEWVVGAVDGGATSGVDHQRHGALGLATKDGSFKGGGVHAAAIIHIHHHQRIQTEAHEEHPFLQP